MACGQVQGVLETGDNRVTGGSDVDNERKLKGDSRALGFGSFYIEEENHRKRIFVYPGPNTTKKCIFCSIWMIMPYPLDEVFSAFKTGSSCVDQAGFEIVKSPAP